jgi:hypothetical protein
MFGTSYSMSDNQNLQNVSRKSIFYSISYVFFMKNPSGSVSGEKASQVYRLHLHLTAKLTLNFHSHKLNLKNFKF